MKFTIKAVEDVVVGDFLATTDGVFCVTQIDAWDLTNGIPLNPPYPSGPSWPVVRLLTTYKGYARFPHENVQVAANSGTPPFDPRTATPMEWREENRRRIAKASGLCRRCGWRPAEPDGVCGLCSTQAAASSEATP